MSCTPTNQMTFNGMTLDDIRLKWVKLQLDKWTESIKWKYENDPDYIEFKNKFCEGIAPI
jgi:hypothetical protein